MAQSKKKTKKTSPPVPVERLYSITLEVLIPSRHVFEVLATSPQKAIAEALSLDWDEPEYEFGCDASPTYCADIAVQDGRTGEYQLLRVPKKFAAPKIVELS